jgi:hypothetical protein
VGSDSGGTSLGAMVGVRDACPNPVSGEGVGSVCDTDVGAGHGDGDTAAATADTSGATAA